GVWERRNYAASVGKRPQATMRKFCEEVREGHLVLLRVGSQYVHGVGEVVGASLWLDDFGDVDGWDLQHVRRVRWLWKCEGKPERFPVYSLKWGGTIEELGQDPKRRPVLDWLRSISVPDAAYHRACRPLPASCKNGVPLKGTSIGAIGDYLFDKGMAATFVDHLLAGMGELVRIANWYKRANVKSSEHETVAYLVVPLLRALGWTPQMMAVEWHHVDVALFDRLPRSDDSLAVTVEAKSRGNACLAARSQAEKYALSRNGCKRLIVTDGLRYGVYLRHPGAREFAQTPVAYLNLLRMKDTYPVLRCGGAQDALLIMAADWRGQIPSSPAGTSAVPAD
ncbi:MAG: hypothetical protein WCK05_14015, partial [Planctomycetota bacterium]